MMAELPDNFVKTGFWIDQSYGSVLGATITTDQRTAVVIIALLAFVVSIAATHLWNIWLFAFHQLRSAPIPSAQDGLYHQQQAFIRSLPASEAVFIDFLHLSWLWRRRVNHSFRRCLLPLTMALLFRGGAIIAGVYTSLAITTTGINVLVNSENCRIPPSTYYSEIIRYDTFNSEIESEILSYAANCYSTNSIPSQCSTFVRSTLPLKTRDVGCPFGSSICLLNSGYELDTGYLDSLDDLGINAEESDRIKYRYNATCAPVQVEGWYSLKNLTRFNALPGQEGSKALPGEQGYLFHYGSAGPNSQSDSNPVHNYPAIIGISTYELNFTHDYITSFIPYGPPESVNARSGGSNLLPSLKTKDADTALIFIFPGQILYTTRVDDPVFSAHEKTHGRFFGTLCRNATECGLYKADYPVGVIGCREQHRFCISSATGVFDDCTEFLGNLQQSLNDRDRKGTWSRMNKVQNTTANFIMTASPYLYSISRLSGPVLQASKHLTYGISTIPLPDDQWKIESKTLVGLVLTRLQVWLATIAHGPLDKGSRNLGIHEPKTPAEEYLCQRFKLKKAGGFANINVFALAFTVAITAILSVMDGILLKIVIYISKVRAHLAPRIEEWIQNGVFQLQSKAHGVQNERAGWERLDKEIPVLIAGQRWSDAPLMQSNGSGSEEPKQAVLTVSSVDSTNSESLSNIPAITPNADDPESLGTTGSEGTVPMDPLTSASAMTPPDLNSNHPPTSDSHAVIETMSVALGHSDMRTGLSQPATKTKKHSESAAAMGSMIVFVIFLSLFLRFNSFWYRSAS